MPSSTLNKVLVKNNRKQEKHKKVINSFSFEFYTEYIFEKIAWTLKINTNDIFAVGICVCNIFKIQNKRTCMA